MWTVGRLARLAGVTARTLRHYDELGLLRPSERSDAGYRLYARADLERLQEILVLRTLGLPLDEIARQLDDPGHDRLVALRRHRVALAARIDDLARALATVDATVAALEADTQVEEEAMFDGLDEGALAQEARERWGETEEYRESARRTRAYGEAEWKAIREEAGALARQFAEARDGGVPAEAPEAAAIAEAHRAHLSRWFYDCTPEIHLGLADLYVADPRFRAWWDRAAPDLADYVHDAIVSAHAG